VKLKMIPFNKIPVIGSEIKEIENAIKKGKLCGDGEYTHLCHDWFINKFNASKVLLTPSCTAALEMAAILIDVKDGDEVIMPSYTFVSTANAFALRGAKIVFVDINPDTMNIDELLIEKAITEKTKAIVPVHYAGVSCNMDFIMKLAEKYSLYVIEDAAQGVMSKYKGKALGTIGHFGTYSFHETKNYTSGGEGGLLLINDMSFSERADIIREKGTNRSQFFRGAVDKYSWVDIGSSFLPSELQAAYLYTQLNNADEINGFRLDAWSHYHHILKPLEEESKIELPKNYVDCLHNAHMFYIKVKNLDERSNLISYLKEKGISAAFHYVPLHSSTAGLNLGAFSGEDRYTTRDSERLIRLPLWYGLSKSEQNLVTSAIFEFYREY
jgi:dTDP-4-amino-4,6-dideoxygalactose transaminase